MTVTTRSGIPTNYRQGRFRSRLEARWAAFFDLVGWSWVYEPFDFNGWIPDFLVQATRATTTTAGARPSAIESTIESRAFLVEVGPCIERTDYVDKAQKGRTAIEAEGFEKPLIVLGVSPLEPWFGLQVGPPDGYPAEAILGVCHGCGSVSVTHAEGYFVHRPCGHYTGGDHGWTIDPENLEETWARAGTTSQWRP